MIKLVCDHCGKTYDNIGPTSYNMYERAQDCDPGTYIGSIIKVVKADEQSVIISKDGEEQGNDYITLDLCDDCAKELNELVANFMNHK